MAEVRFVGPHLLGCHDDVNGDRELRPGRREQVIVAVGEDREPPPGRSQRAERAASVLEYRHARPCLYQSAGLRGVKRDL
jgi:hypothetical protein